VTTRPFPAPGGFRVLPLASLATLAAIVLPGPAAAAPPCEPALGIVNAKVFTVDRARPWAEAVGVCGERIDAVGTSDEIRRALPAGAHIVDAGGRLVVPGFNDAHVHLVDGAKDLLSVNLRDATSSDEMRARVAAYVAKTPKGRWILGGFWDHEAWPDHALPTRALMDAAAPDHPVFLQRLDGHMAVANSRALALAGVTRDTPVPEGGAIVKDASGEIAGVLKDNAMGLVDRAIPAPSYEETLTGAKAALAHAASLGVTTVQDLTTSADQLRVYQALRASGELPVRIYATQQRPYEEFVTMGVATGFGDDWLRIGGVKLYADGSMGSGTAAFFEAYADDPSTRGLLLQSPEALKTLVFDADAAGFQLLVHAIGDRANAVVLDIVEALARERGPRDRRVRIEHAQVVRDADKARFAKAGVIASIQPSHCTDDMRWAEKRIGTDRCALAYDFKSFLDAGVRVAFGTDWYVEPLDPMIGLHAAVTRQFADGTPAGGWHPEERIPMAQAVELYTLGSAYAEFAETRKGSIAPGKLADMVMLSRDLFTIPAGDILGTKPVLTIVGGRIVYEAPK
jgi:predicted amidohydrolase YtcJ